MSKINLYFNKNTKKLEETVFLKKNIIIPKFSFPKKRRFSSPISRSPGPGQYHINVSLTKNSIYGIVFPKESKRYFAYLQIRYFSRDYRSHSSYFCHTDFYKTSNAPKFSFSRTQRFKQDEKINYDKHKSIYI